MRPIEQLKSAPYSELDYVYLSNLFAEYARPRQEISRLLKAGGLIRVKKGLYVRSPALFPPFSKEVLANLIYGPSYISLEYALSIYGAIPERVEQITSITCNRKKNFITPVGIFSYQYLPLERYSLGIKCFPIDDNRCFLLASIEKALVDKIWFNRSDLRANDLEAYLYEDLRIEKGFISKLREPRLKQILSHYNSTLMKNLMKIVKKSKGLK